MGPRDWAMRDDDGHPLGDFASVHAARGAHARFPRRRRHGGRGRVRRADPAVCRRELGAVPGLHRSGAIVGVRTCEWERGRRGANVGHAHWAGPPDAPGTYGPRYVPSI